MRVRASYLEMIANLAPVFGDGEATAMARLVFEHIGLPTRFIEPGNDATLSDTHASELLDITDRLLNNEPIQYVLQEAWFYGLRLEVNPSVLIPRPETEELVKEAIDFIDERPLRVLDVGTGSGCIALAIKTKKPFADVHAIDVSPEALETAKLNGNQCGVQVNFFHTNFLDAAARGKLLQYDVIISNPPYIPQSEKALMETHVTAHEPAQALFVPDEEPLMFYKALAAFGKNHLKEEGKLFMEVHQDLGEAVKNLFEKEGYETELKKDINHNDRMVLATRCR